MIKGFKDFSVNEDNNDYIKELLSKIENLEKENDALIDQISDLDNQIIDLEDASDKKSDKIYDLEDDFSKLEKEKDKLETELEKYEKKEQDLNSEISSLSKQLEIINDPYGVITEGTEEDKQELIYRLKDILNVMEDYPLEIGGLIGKEFRPKFDRLLYVTLNKEWLDGFTGKGASLLNKFGV